MQFTLKLTPSVVGTSILTDETPLDGMTFLEKATDILKRNIDPKIKTSHKTLGILNSYEIDVPRDLAIESGQFETSSSVYVQVSEDFLRPFVFYYATMNYNPITKSYYYPYNSAGLVLTTMIDELSVLDYWKTNNFASTLTYQLP